MGKSINSVESVPMADKTKQFTATYGTASDEEDVSDELENELFKDDDILG